MKKKIKGRFMREVRWVVLRVKKWLCKVFGHNFYYYLVDGRGGSQRQIRFCNRCLTAQEYRVNVHYFGSDWFTLVMRTKKGGQNLLKKLEEQKNGG